MIGLRKTSDYRIDVPGGDDHLLRDMVRRCPLAVSGSGGTRGGVFLRVRVADDFRALQIADLVTEGREYVLRTGYGVNERTVVARIWKGRCWDCGSSALVMRPDEGMHGATDEIVCLECGERQNPDSV